MIITVGVKCISDKSCDLSRIILQTPYRTAPVDTLESLKNQAFVIKNFHVKYSEHDEPEDISLWDCVEKGSVIFFDEAGLKYSFFSKEEFDKLYHL